MEPRSSFSLVPLVRSDSRTVGGSVHTGRRANTTVILNNQDTARVWEDGPAPGRSPVTPGRNLDSNGPEVQASEVGGNRRKPFRLNGTKQLPTDSSLVSVLSEIKWHQWQNRIPSQAAFVL